MIDVKQDGEELELPQMHGETPIRYAGILEHAQHE